MQLQARIPYDCYPKITSLQASKAQSMNYLRKVALGTKSDYVSSSVSKSNEYHNMGDPLPDLSSKIP